MVKIDEYKEKLVNIIQDSLNHYRQPFDELVRNCHGAFPTIVHELLMEYASTNEYYSQCFSTKIVKDSICTSVLDTVENNPALSGWYFTDETCRKLSSLREWHTERIAFLGTPRLYEWFCRHSIGGRRTLFDLDSCVVDILEAATRNVADTNRAVIFNAHDETTQDFKDQFDIVFFDPPWYLDEYYIWLERCRELAPSGSVFFSLFPDLTRPSAMDERNEIISHCRLLSLTPLVVSNVLEYIIPTFESAQLKASGITCSKPWKLSDLVILNLDRSSRTGDAHSRPIPKTENWQEIDIGKMRLFINVSMPSKIGSRLLLLPPGGTSIMPSPSRRYLTDHGINVLSSRGHGLKSEDPQELLSILQSGLKNSNGDIFYMADTLPGFDTDERQILNEMIGENIGR